jgi:uncharacterized membrane protein
MSPTVWIVLLWLGFAGSHMLLSSVRLRPLLVERLGERRYAGVFSLVALGFFVPLAWTYFANKHYGDWLWTLPAGPVFLWTVYVLMGVAFVLMVASFTQPNPSMMGAGPGEARGVFRITRHPLLMGIALFAFLHLLRNANTADAAFFGGLLAFSVVGSLHQDARKLATEVPGYREFHEATVLVPFTGEGVLQGIRELPPLAVVIGVTLTVVLRVFHGTLFGT